MLTGESYLETSGRETEESLKYRALMTRLSDIPEMESNQEYSREQSHISLSENKLGLSDIRGS